MAEFTSADGSRIQVDAEEGAVVVFQDLAGVQGRGPARLTPADALALADAIVTAAEQAGAPAHTAAEQAPAEDEVQA